MGASYGKLTRGHEEALYEMRKAKKTGRQMREALARGIPGEPPVSISLDRCLKISRRLLEERDELYESKIQGRPAPEGLRIIAKRLMLIAERETLRLEKAERVGRLDANKLGRLATAVTKLHGLLERNEALLEDEAEAQQAKRESATAPEAQRSSFADGLLSADPEPDPAPDAQPQSPAPAPSAPVADVAIVPKPRVTHHPKPYKASAEALPLDA